MPHRFQRRHHRHHYLDTYHPIPVTTRVVHVQPSSDVKESLQQNRRDYMIGLGVLFVLIVMLALFMKKQ